MLHITPDERKKLGIPKRGGRRRRRKPKDRPLPGWARRCKEVTALCSMNPEFKQAVISATDPRLKRILIQKARQTIRSIVECS